MKTQIAKDYDYCNKSVIAKDKHKGPLNLDLEVFKYKSCRDVTMLKLYVLPDNARLVQEDIDDVMIALANVYKPVDYKAKIDEQKTVSSHFEFEKRVARNVNADHYFDRTTVYKYNHFGAERIWEGHTRLDFDITPIYRHNDEAIYKVSALLWQCDAAGALVGSMKEVAKGFVARAEGIHDQDLETKMCTTAAAAIKMLRNMKLYKEIEYTDNFADYCDGKTLPGAEMFRLVNEYKEFFKTYGRQQLQERNN